MKKQFSIALLTLAIAQVSQAGVLNTIIGTTAPEEMPGIGGMSLGDAPGIGAPLTTLAGTLPEPIGSNTESGLPSGIPEELPAPGELPTAPTGFTAVDALTAALETGLGYVPQPDPANFEAAAAVVQDTLTNAGGETSPEDQLLAGVAFADEQIAKGITDGSAAFFAVIANPAAEGQKLADGSYALDGAETFQTEFNAYRDLFVGGGGSPADPIYDNQPGVQDQVIGAIAGGASQLAEAEATAITTISGGAFAAPATIRAAITDNAPAPGGEPPSLEDLPVPGEGFPPSVPGFPPSFPPGS